MYTLLKAFNIKYAMLAVAIAGLLLSYSFPLMSHAQTGDSNTSASTTTDDTTVDDTADDDDTSNDDDDSDDANDDEANDDDDSDSSGSDRRAQLQERLEQLRAIVAERMAAIEARKARFAELKDTRSSTIDGLSDMTPEERRAALMTRVDELRAMVAERRAAIEAQHSSFGDQRQALLDRVQALRDALAARKAAREHDHDSHEHANDDANDDDDHANDDANDDDDHANDDANDDDHADDDDTASSTDQTS